MQENEGFPSNEKTMSKKKELREYLADILSEFKGEVYVERQIRVIMKMAKDAFEESDDETKISKEDVNEVYSAYPNRCVSTGRNLGKGGKDKVVIERLLKKNTKDYLIATIERYVADCKKDKVYMKNFSTFLSNPPEYDLTEKPKTVEISGYRDLRKITEAQ